MWSKMSITKKIMISGSILVIGYFIAMSLSFIVALSSENRLVQVSKVLFPASQQSQIAVAAFDEQVKLYKDAVMTGEATAIDTAQSKADVIGKALDTIHELTSAGGRQSGDLAETIQLHKAYTASAKDVYTKMSSGGTDEQIMNQAMALSKQSDDIRTRLVASADGYATELHANLASIASNMRQQRYVSIVTFLVVVGVGSLLVMMILLGSVRAPIHATVSMIRDIAEGEGDLTKRLAVKSKDELGELSTWFNQFITQLEEIIVRIKLTAREMDESTQVVSSESLALSQSTQEQASSVEEVASTIEEMTSSIKQNAKAATGGLDVTREIVAKADNSAQISHELIAAMKEISGASKKIGDIISTVNEVAFQTNLLALNAAVEAARAGEHGKGFAVVAEEVRALAQRSSEAARQIKILIEDTVGKITAGDVMVTKSGEAMNEIREFIDRLAQSMEEITASSAEQAVGADNVNKAIAQIDSMTQKNATVVEQLAGMSEKLSIEAERLAHAVGQFKVSEQG